MCHSFLVFVCQIIFWNCPLESVNVMRGIFFILQVFNFNQQTCLACGGQQPIFQFSPFILNLPGCSLSVTCVFDLGYPETWADIMH